MKKLSCLFKDLADFEKNLAHESISTNKECLVGIFTAALNEQDSAYLASEVKKLLPNSVIIGASSSSLIFNADMIDNETLIIVLQFDSLKIKSEVFQWGNKSPEALANEVFNTYKDDPENLIHLIFSDNYKDINGFALAINEYNPVLKLIGGISSPLRNDRGNGFVFNEKGPVTNGLLSFQLTGKPVNDAVICNTPDDPISDVYEITKVNGSIIEEVENVPSAQWFNNYFNIDDPDSSLSEYNFAFQEAYLVHFLMLLDGHNGAGRFLKYDSDHNSLSLYFSNIPNHSKFRMGYFNPMKSREKLYKMYTEMQERSIEFVFAYACVFRYEFFRTMIETELQPLRDLNVSGLFMHGEICNIKGKNEVLNGSFLLSELAEKESPCNIDMEAFNHTAKIKLDSSIIDFVMSAKRDELIKRANSPDLDKSDTDIGVYTRFSNIIQYHVDNKKYNFNKILMIYVENADMIIGSEGYSSYVETVIESISQINDFIVFNRKEKPYIYELNYCTYVMAFVKEDDELLYNSIMQNLFSAFRIMQPECTHIPLVIKFVIAEDDDDVLQQGMTGLQETKRLNIPYLIYNDKIADNSEAKHESYVIRILKDAIDGKKVVPYFQGIHNNKTGEIDRYESLMRIVDDDEVYLPGFFMDISKKYHIYLSLSKLMIGKVLETFKNRKEYVSINISAYEIYSEEFSKWFWNKMDNFDEPERIVLEIVESEELTDWERVTDFLGEARKRGLKISVDDFGSGYSNLMQIIRLAPDYVKIDGSIVKNVCMYKESMIIIQTIHFLAQNIKAEVVAEFVENREIQDLIEKEGIHYSQGFYFCKPLPIEEIDKGRHK